MNPHPLGPLFTGAAHSDEGTSREAAKRIVPHKSRLQAMVLEAMHGGATAQEIEERTGLAGNTVRPRLVELRLRGLVEDSGERRETQAGRLAVVWREKR